MTLDCSCHSLLCCLIAVDCGDPGSGAYLVRTGSEFTYGRAVVYSCPPGYDVIGAHSLVCMSNGRWSSQPPSCTPVKCSKLPALPRNSHFLSVNSTYRGVAVAECDKGYKISGSSRSSAITQAVCLADRTFSTLEYICQGMGTFETEV